MDNGGNNGGNNGESNGRDSDQNIDNKGANLAQIKDTAPETGDGSLLELYVVLATIAGFTCLLLYFLKRRRGNDRRN